MNAADPRAPRNTNNAIFPFWSPDGRSIGFLANGKLKMIELNRTTARELSNVQLGRGSYRKTRFAGGMILFSGTYTPGASSLYGERRLASREQIKHLPSGAP